MTWASVITLSAMGLIYLMMGFQVGGAKCTHPALLTLIGGWHFVCAYALWDLYL